MDATKQVGKKGMVLVFGLAVALLLSLAGCQGTTKEAADTGAAKASDAAKVEASEDAAKTSEQVAEDEAALALGTVDGGTYASSFLGISCTVPEGWAYATQDQLNEMSGIVPDLMDSEKLKKQMESAEVVYDMVATNASTGESVNVVIQNVGLVYGALVSEEQAISASVDGVVSAMEGMGFTDLATEQVNVEFAGASRPALNLTGSYQGMPVFQQVIAMKKGNYMACVTLSSFNDNTLDAERAFFSTTL